MLAQVPLPELALGGGRDTDREAVPSGVLLSASAGSRPCPSAPAKDPELEPDAIRSANGTIHRAFVRSPQFVHEGLSRLAGVEVVVKVEAASKATAVSWAHLTSTWTNID